MTHTDASRRRAPLLSRRAVISAPFAGAALVAAGPLADQAALAATVTLRPGSRGAAVATAQRRLTALGYWLGAADGVYGGNTTHAVVALQKAAGLSRDGILGPRTAGALARGVRPVPRSRTGRRIEVDLTHQLLLVAVSGRAVRILDASTGSGRTYVTPSGHTAVATTPVGTFAVSWAVNGWRTSDLGHLYRPRYFHPRGIAVHGYPSVPAYPASHGCVRVTPAAMDMLWATDAMPIGGTVSVYR